MTVIGSGGHRNGGDRQTHDLAESKFDAASIVGVVFQELARVFPALAQAFTLEREPCAALIDDVLFDSEIEQVAFARDTFAIHDVEFGFAERRSNLVLHDLHLRAAADDFVSIFDRGDPPHIGANRSVELQGAAAGGRFRIAEHDADLFADLVDEDHARLGLARHSADLAQGLRHEPGLETDEVVAHMREKVEIPEQVEIINRKKPGGLFLNKEKYKPYAVASDDAVPVIPNFGEGFRFNITGLIHDETGFPNNSPETTQKLLTRLHKKLTAGYNEIKGIEINLPAGAEVALLSYGSNSLPAQFSSA